MAKEEAIKYLQQLYPKGGHCWLGEQRIEAIGMAMNALQEEPASEDLEKELDNWRHIHFSGRRDGKLSGEYLERSSQLDLARHFVNWQKQQMMKDAVDGEIAILKTRLGQMLIAKLEILNDEKFKWGDKVKLIIIKED